ncbi:DsbA family oxidoreductase [Thalassotalea agarivorans]|uniref:Predicted dithiol-disulfide isomerase, DsbA family n=1 Tax=Thalassotalea agarivorans TaxID=349064 RepID=A0A1I0GI44_THASX|nr:DsbA family oxidoreductase [Thalassotalea agarivorans]SET70575.1 Predicted dithiol-disulfide isomerase, DsbA family [Thalassotalea agarivorans]
MAQSLKIDIVSDVVCPWCYVGYKQLETAANQLGVELDITWQPFQLNPQMPEQGQNLREHIMEKYGSTAQESADARARLQTIGEDLGITFNFADESRIYNTFACHVLLYWAEKYNKQHELKLALFEAYFSQGKNISDLAILMEILDSVGLDVAQAELALADESLQQRVQSQANTWTGHGISSVPSMIIVDKYLVAGAQGVENYVSIINQILAEQA